MDDTKTTKRVAAAMANAKAKAVAATAAMAEWNAKRSVPSPQKIVDEIIQSTSANEFFKKNNRNTKFLLYLFSIIKSEESENVEKIINGILENYKTMNGHRLSDEEREVFKDYAIDLYKRHEEYVDKALEDNTPESEKNELKRRVKNYSDSAKARSDLLGGSMRRKPRRKSKRRKSKIRKSKKRKSKRRRKTRRRKRNKRQKRHKTKTKRKRK